MRDCGTVTYAAARPGFHPSSVSYGPVLNGAVFLSCFGNVPAELAGLAGYLMTDGYTGYQHLAGTRVKGIQQCCQRIIRRARQVRKLGPGGVQNWAGHIITVLRDAHRAVDDSRARGSTALGPQVLDDLRERYDTAVESGRVHNRLRDRDGGGNHPGYALACWLRDYKEQVFLFTAGPGHTRKMVPAEQLPPLPAVGRTPNLGTTLMDT